MIKLTAEIKIDAPNPSVFSIGSILGSSFFGSQRIDRTEKIDSRTMLSLESEIKSTADVNKLSFGLISSGGSISFKDVSSRFFAYATTNLLHGNEKIKIYLEETISGNKQQVGEYYSSDWQYDVDNMSVSVSLQDGLEKIQDIEYDGYNETSYDTNNNFNVLDVLNIATNELFGYIEDKLNENGYSFDETARDKLIEYLKVVILAFPYLKKGNLWMQLTKFCDILGANMYINEYGNIDVKGLV